MLDNVSDKIRECHRHAEDCETQARAQPDPALRQDFLNAAQRWMRLAASYEFAERLERFTFKPKR